MASKRLKVSEQLRRAIEKSGMTRYAICKVINLQQSAMSRFMAGEQGLSLEIIDKLGDLLELRLTSEQARED